MNVLCRNGHQVPSGSKFCNQCGEAVSEIGGLESPTNADLSAENWAEALQPGIYLRERYIILNQLGQGGFARTYLAEDMGRFREKFVIKEFVPSLRNTAARKKAEELFQREAAILHQLKHPQIPRFWEIFWYEKRIFLVVDYIEGTTYKDLLEQRLQQGQCFSESEILDLFQKVLPVLRYLHQRGVIHRDISPDNIICRTPDHLPILIDLGGVKQVAMEVGSQLEIGQAFNTESFTRLGKAGYAPDEQIRFGLVAPHSDLHALAVTALVLMSGKKPQQLLNPNTLQWMWEQELRLSPRLASVMNQMLAFKPADRFQTADEVLQALSPLFSILLSQQSNSQTNSQTAISAPAFSPVLERSEGERSGGERSEGDRSNSPPRSWHRGQTLPKNGSARRPVLMKWLVPALLVLAGGLAYLAWENYPLIMLRIAGKELPRNSDLQLRSAMQEVNQVPTGLFNYGGAPAFASLTANGMNDAISRAHPEFRLRYTEPPTGSPGSGTGINMLINGELSLAQSARPLEEEDYNKAKARGFSLEQVPIAIDGVVFFTHRGLNIPGLSVEQLQAIYKGQMTNWQQAGGPNLPIVPIGLDPKITSALKLLLGSDEDQISPKVEIVRDFTAAIRKVATTPGGISYSSAPLVITQKMIRPIALAKGNSNQYVQPFIGEQEVNTSALKDGTYPLTRRFFIVLRRDGSIDEKAAIAYINMVLSKEGQRIVEQAGYAAIR